MPSFPSINNDFAEKVKSYAKSNIKVFCTCLILLDFLNCL